MTIEEIKTSIEKTIDQAYERDDRNVVIVLNNVITMLNNLEPPSPWHSYPKEKPKKDGRNFFCTRQIGKRFDMSLSNQRQEGCPLVEIPKEHGRIVDLDKVLDWLINEDGRFSMATCAKIDNALRNAPVIMEASDG